MTSTTKTNGVERITALVAVLTLMLSAYIAWSSHEQQKALEEYKVALRQAELKYGYYEENGGLKLSNVGKVPAQTVQMQIRVIGEIEQIQMFSDFLEIPPREAIFSNGKTFILFELKTILPGQTFSLSLYHKGNLESHPPSQNVNVRASCATCPGLATDIR